MLVLAGTLVAQADDYPYLTFQKTDGTTQPVDVSGLVLTFSNGQLIATTSSGNVTFSLMELSKMYFSTSGSTSLIANGLAFSSTTATATLGQTFTTPTLTNPYNLSVTWASTEEGVATVNQAGSVTLVGVGTTVISASFAGDDTYLAGSVSYTLTVEKAEPVDNGLAFASTTATATLGEDFTPPSLLNPYCLKVYWESSDETVATVDVDGYVRLIAAGETVISATFAGDDTYLPGTVSYTLTVEKPAPVDNGLAFSSTTATATLGEEFTPPVLSNPYNLPLTWTSSDEKVASVDDAGAVTLLGAGITDIAAMFAGNDDYLAGTVTYTLTVEELVVDAISDMNAGADDRVSVYTLSGVLVGRFETLSQAQAQLAEGFYVVKTYDGKSKKVKK